MVVQCLWISTIVSKIKSNDFNNYQNLLSISLAENLLQTEKKRYETYKIFDR